ncbi:hypothetical protein V8F20_012259, partial [Naviculisporaceae sp. PSN 640]
MLTTSDGKTAGIATVIGLLTSMSLTFLTLRLYSRLRYQKGFSLDDYLLVVGWILLCVSATLTYAACSNGLGRHLKSLDPGQATNAKMYLIFCGQFALAAACLSQISISVTLFRIGATKSQRLILWTVVFSVIFTKVVSMFLVFTVCTPVQRLWQEDGGECRSYMFKPIVRFWVFAAATSAVGDLVLVALPWQILWRLQMRKMEKFGLGLAFTAGIFSAATSICEAVHIPEGNFSGDVTYSDLVMWTFAEPSVIIMAASVPFLHKLVQDVIKGFNTLARKCDLKGTSDTLPTSLPAGLYRSYPAPSSSDLRYALTPYPCSTTGNETTSGSDDIDTPIEGGSNLTTPICNTERTDGRRVTPTRNSYPQVADKGEEATRSGILKTSEVIVQSDQQDRHTDGTPVGLGIIESGKPCGLIESQGTYKSSVISTPIVISNDEDKEKE